MSRPIITLLTDFGTADAYVGIMKGVILGICREAQIVDLSHEVAPQDVVAGALLLRSAVSYFPAGTIHVAVVDPGVGGTRAAMAVETAGAILIGPDNGLLHPASLALGGGRAVALTRSEFRLPRVSRSFHGRDVFAPAAAHIAAGVALADLGEAAAGIEPLPLPSPRISAEAVVGEVVYVDRFGNLLTNVSESEIAAFQTRGVSISIGGCAAIPLVAAYEQVAPGDLLALVGSWGSVEIAVRDGNAARRLGVGVGTAVRIGSR